ncbi:MAG: holo-[acyl-carrier protein] synthase [Gammaproteobacteria bacterium]|jgi:holo-[acyl-carrier protein] synthase|tara:strand:+ start:5959 stop:6336 length:378 start_codon:yes stop_codon:yes gene_type:complete
MIYGMGTDIASISRFKKIDSLENFAVKILSINELEIFNGFKEFKQITYLAKQFAGKEAISKAFGTGIRSSITFTNIEILRDDKGKPVFNALNDLNDLLTDLGITKTHVSLADEKNYAIAFAILEI